MRPFRTWTAVPTAVAPRDPIRTMILSPGIRYWDSSGRLPLRKTRKMRQTAAPTMRRVRLQLRPDEANLMRLNRPDCQKPQAVRDAIIIEGQLKNRCRWCRGPLRELTTKELRELMDAQNRLKDGGDR